MDKLSSILPSNARVKTVDIAESHPIRPGTPEFGRRMGANRLRDKVTISDEAKSSNLLSAKAETLNSGRNPKEDASVKIAEKITSQFFAKKLAPLQEAKGEVLSEEIADTDVETTTQAPVPATLTQPTGAQAPAKPISVYA